MSDLRNTTDPALLAESTRALTIWMETTGTLAKEFTETLEQVSTSKTLKALKSFGDTFKSMAKASFQGAALSMLMETLQPLLDLLDVFSPIFQAIGVLLQAVFLPVIQDLMPIIQFITQAIIALVPYARQLWEIIKVGLIVVFQGLLVALKAIGDFIVGVFVNAWNTIWNVLKLVGDFVAGVFLGVWNTLVFVFKSIANAIVAAINFIIDLINFFGNLVSFGLFPDIGHLSYLAKGGIVTQATMGVVGEAGPEAVIPLNQAGGVLGGDNELHLIDIKNALQEQLILQKKQARTMNKRRFG